MIGLNEVKTTECVSLPGYVCYRNTGRTDGHRGGTVVLVKRWLQASVMSLDVEMKDQVWIKLPVLSSVLLGFVYVPPTDSQYFNPNSFSYIQEKIISGKEENCSVVLLGDLNTRFGCGVRNILGNIRTPDCDNLAYPVIPDKINSANENANIMSTVCIEQSMVVLNNLKFNERYFESKLTYRKKSEWVSEVDVCIASRKMLCNVESFSVNNDLSLPSDHAPIAAVISPPVVDRRSLDMRARSLGDHATLYSRCRQRSQPRRHVKYEDINNENFIGELSRFDIPQFNEDIDTTVKQMTDILHDCAIASMSVQVTPIPDNSLIRWERL